MAYENTWKTMGTVPAVVRRRDPIIIDEFPQEWRDMLADLYALWESKLMRNKLRKRYYYGHNALKDLGIAIPPQLRNLEAVVCWPQKAVDSLAVRSQFDGFFASSPETQAMLDAIVRRSRLDTKYRQARHSTLIHSCSFVTVTTDERGQARIDIYSAEDAAARWDKRRGCIAYGMTIEEYREGKPSRVTLYTDDARVELWADELDLWHWEAQHYTMGRPTMEAIVYRRTDDRPFGQSRVSRAVMSTTDSAVRECVRGEISAEFATSPQKYLLGVDDGAFANKTMWEAYIGNIMAIGRDENGEVPQFGQLSQGSMEQHASYMRQLAAKFSGETNVPISQLGVIHDNPSSAEAMQMACEPLVIEAEDFNAGARDALNTVALMAIAAELDVPMDELPSEYTDFTANFKSAALPSIVSQSDAMVKLASVVPGFAGTSVFYEQVGFGEDTRRRVMAEVARANAVDAIQALEAATVEAV